MFEFGKTPNVDKKSFVLVVNEFWDCVEVVFVLLVGIGLDWFCVMFVKKRKMLSFQRKYCQNFVKNPCSCFGYRLSYNHLNEVILIGKKA